jgi:hypothetical protein
MTENETQHTLAPAGRCTTEARPGTCAVGRFVRLLPERPAAASHPRVMRWLELHCQTVRHTQPWPH